MVVMIVVLRGSFPLSLSTSVQVACFAFHYIYVSSCCHVDLTIEIP